MTKRLNLLTFLIVCLFECSFAQKPSVDTTAYESWPTLDDPEISNNGNFISYTIHNKLVAGATEIIRGAHTDWEIELPFISIGKFTADSHLLVFLKNGDSLGIVTLGNDSVRYIPGVRSFQLLETGTHEYLAYQKVLPEKKLVLLNLNTFQETYKDDVKSFLASENGQALILELDPGKDDKMETLEWVSLPGLKQTEFFRGINPGNFVFDSGCGRLCFTAKDTASQRNGRAIWYFQLSTNKLDFLVDDWSADMKPGFCVDRVLRFGYDGKGLFFTLKKADQQMKPGKDVVMVDVWSYSDPKLQSRQLRELDGGNFWQTSVSSYTSIVHFTDHRIIGLEQENEQIIWPRGGRPAGNYVLVRQNEGGDIFDEWTWNNRAKINYVLVSIVNGARKKVPESSRFSLASEISPGGNFFIYYDLKQKSYISYEVATAKYRNITRGIKASWTDDDNTPGGEGQPIWIAGFLKGDTGLLIYSKYDIFQVSMNGKQPPICITDGLGQKNHLEFRLAMRYGDQPIYPGERLILNAFDKISKDNGFYSIFVGQVRPGNPELLTMQPYMFGGSRQDDEGLGQPKKAKDAEAYIIRRMSGSESPNYYWTSDFKSFAPISNTHPEMAYNWLTTELITWKTLNGSLSQGILYKPENFDPQKKYPVIFYSYEQFSDGLHRYHSPEFSIGGLNIPEYVANGYLVFTPDIHFEKGHTGRSAFNSIVSAARYLSHFPWVNAAKMGIQGHSFGAYETYYLVTHTGIFAAAEAGEGEPDWISGPGGLTAAGGCKQVDFELGQYRMGTTLWERPDLYVENSPIFFAGKVTTPLLITADKEDSRVPFAQGIEMFTALRRLGKKAWLLQYDGQDHVILGDASRDFTVRMRQFFDHYLKDTPAPKWMVEGIPAAKKGIETGLELEPPGVEPGPGLLTPEEQKKIDALQHRKPVTVTIP